MIKHDRKIKTKKLLNKGYKPKLYKAGDQIRTTVDNYEMLWTFQGYMGTGEQVWYNEIDGYIFMGNIN